MLLLAATSKFERCNRLEIVREPDRLTTRPWGNLKEFFPMRLLLAIAVLLIPVPAHAGETKGGPFLNLSCPAKGSVTRSFDISTGVAPWIATGPGIPNGSALATPIDETTLPHGWSARLVPARWVQALPVTQSAPHAPGDYRMILDFQIPKSKRSPSVQLTGDVIADEGFDLTLIEPAPPSTSYVSGTGFGDDSPGIAPQDDVQPVMLDKSADQSGRALGVHTGRYRIEIVLPNGTADQGALGLLARLKLTMTCRGK